MRLEAKPILEKKVGQATRYDHISRLSRDMTTYIQAVIPDKLRLNLPYAYRSGKTSIHGPCIMVDWREVVQH